MLSEIHVFKCFLCACAANGVGREATDGPPQELATKRLVCHMYIIIRLHIYTIMHIYNYVYYIIP